MVVSYRGHLLHGLHGVDAPGAISFTINDLTEILKEEIMKLGSESQADLCNF